MKKTILSFLLALVTIMCAVMPVSALPRPKQRGKVTILSEDKQFISTDENYYNAGETVTVYTHSNSEKYVYDIDAVGEYAYNKYHSTSSYPVENMGDGTFTFEMPKYDIILFPGYKKPDKNINIDYKAPYEIIRFIYTDKYKSQIDPFGDNVYKRDGFTFAVSKAYAYEGDKITFTIEPSDGYIIDRLLLNERVSKDPIEYDYNEDTQQYSFTMPGASVGLSVNFIKEHLASYHDIKLEYDKHLGDVDVSLDNARRGEKIYLYVETDNGVSVENIDVRGLDTDKSVDIKDSGDDYFFYMPDEGVVIAVTFEEEYVEKYYDIELEYDSFFGDAAISLDSATESEKVYVYVEPDDGVSVDSIYVRGGETDSHINVKNGGDKSYFYMPDESVVVTVTFEEIDTESKDSIDEDIEAETEPELETEPPAPTVHICPAKAYFDVDTNAWYHDAVDYVILSGLMGGYSESTFAPEDTTTRAMIATILWRVEGSPTPTSENPFVDVPDSTWYTDAVIWASEKGIVNGIGSSMFNPDGDITREQLAAMIYRYAKAKGDTRSYNPDVFNYPDVADISDFAKDALIWCDTYGILNIRQGSVLPKAPAQRAEAAFFVYKISAS